MAEAKHIEQAHLSEALACRHADVPNNAETFDVGDFSIQLLNGTFDLGETAVFHRLTVIADTGHAAGS
jgi:hypothetical protein